MRRARHIWVLFGLGLIAVLSVMIGLTWTVLRLESESLDISRSADAEAKTRLALWRMDSALAPLIARESARSSDEFTEPPPAGLKGGRRSAARLPRSRSPYVRIYFQVDADGYWSAAPVPTADRPGSAQDGDGATESQLAALRQTTDLVALLAAIRNAPSTASAAPTTAPSTFSGYVPEAPSTKGNAALQKYSNTIEEQARNRHLQQQLAFNTRLDTTMDPTLTPCWIKDELLLARVKADFGVEGCWLDRPSLERWLLEEIADLFPDATLAPPDVGKSGPEAHALAALPLVLQPGRAAVEFVAPAPSSRAALRVAWSVFAIAATAAGIAVAGFATLNERRAAFVSAVTHELRTPLTTFQLYTELLTRGLLDSDAKRTQYLQTLHREAGRLAHLVDNVLAFARLERSRPRVTCEVVSLREVLDRVTPRITERAMQGGATVTVHSVSPADANENDHVQVRANPPQVEQILLNLVDNACKYAAGGRSARIELEPIVRSRRLILQIRDHGPGIDRQTVRRLFKPFHKSAHESATGPPGVGLGLALSRRLARSMGGDLRYIDNRPGACFELSLRYTSSERERQGL